eukprot:gnl/TRDRNA2_/TRDRNA2_35404_c0_seq1.p1 gnl/TRDRNA2_/TRDRNA2_35404_c0~~gnl/TRDRNA2_/TRDRNA2_35404_c0_seq1.p1  ORF type:complete len:399 (+),score=55.00 gnl/TRDRNA2_/TRDRNA2_35404_c0_seq1:151-1347(+)
MGLLARFYVARTTLNLYLILSCADFAVAKFVLPGSLADLGQGVSLEEIHLVAEHAAFKNWFWLFGSALAVFGASLTVIGLLMQKASHNVQATKTNQTMQQEPEPPYWTQPRWLGGGALWLTGQLICWFSLGFGNQTMLACLSNCLNIVTIFMFAPMLGMGESASRDLVLGAGLLMLGGVWVVLFGPKAYHKMTPQYISHRWCQWPIIGLTSLAVSGVLVMVFLMRVRRSSGTVHALLYTGTSACFAWYAVLQAKCTAALFVVSTGNLADHIFWLLGLGTAACALCQIHLLNMGLKHGRAVLVLPTYESISMVGQVIIGGIFFNEFDNLTVLDHVRFWSGVACILCGVAILAFRGHDLNGEESSLLESSAQSFWARRSSMGRRLENIMRAPATTRSVSV